ncbi:MAG: hypothetical protein JWP15_695 [Alphaproteobacteria bacterium]|nr:hypothetical protein [Alphaproteobacteria bacterium]
MNLLLRPWRRLVDFRGRSTRREFGLLHVQSFAVLFLLSALTGIGDDTEEVSVRAAVGALFLLLFVPVSIVALLTAGVRRLHDRDKPGWMLLLNLIPLVGWIFFLVLVFAPGTAGENSYGYDPREGDRPSLEEIGKVFS